MPPTELESPPEAPQQAIQYARGTAPVTRRQFRFLLLLTLLNTILLGAFVCGPAISQFTRSAVQDYKTRRQIRQKSDQLDTLLAQSSGVTFPADHVIYEENPVEAAKLLKESQDFIALPLRNSSVPASWQTPVLRVDSPPVAQLLAQLYGGSPQTTATLMLHTLKKPNGESRLVLVLITADQDFSRAPEQRYLEGTGRQISVSTQRRLSAVVINKNDDPQAPSLNRTSTHLIPEMKLRTTAIDPKGLFRFYAARLDTNDPAHFLIDYALDGQRSSIDGYLKDDDTVTFVPRAGRIIDDRRNNKIWQPLTVPATQPLSPSPGSRGPG